MNCCKHKYFVIYRGDDTDFPGNQELIVELNTERDLTGCSAHFSFQGFTQDFAEIPSDKKLRLVIPNSETGKFALGAADAKLWLTNGTKIRTVENRIHVVVTNNVNEAYNNDDPQAITVTISGGGSGATVVLDDTVAETSSNGVKSSGIWSWVKSLLPKWLTSDYAEPATAASVAAKADQSALDSHVKNTNNPHAVTAAQIGAVPLIKDDFGGKTAVTIGSRNPESSVGESSLANGDGVRAEGIGTHAEGAYTTAYGVYSHVSGVNSLTKISDSYAFAWNGDRNKTYTSHGPGTFNINPVGGIEGFYLGEQTLPQVISAAITGKANKVAPSAAGNLAALTADGDIEDSGKTVGDFLPRVSDGPVDSSLFMDMDGYIRLERYGFIYGSFDNIREDSGSPISLRTELDSKVDSFESIGGASATVNDGVAKLDNFFTESNSLLNGRLAYSRNATGLKDRAFNTLSFDGTEYNLSTALAAVTPTASGQPRDLLIVATATAATTISFTAGTIKGDKPTIDGSGTWLITLTEYASGVWYCRQIKMEDAA